MSEYIEREKLLSLIQKWQDVRSTPFNQKDNIVIEAIVYAIKNQPAIDITICRNCKYREDRLYCRRTKTPFITTNMDYCSLGKEKKNENLD